MDKETNNTVTVVGWDIGREDNQGPIVRLSNGTYATILRSGYVSMVMIPE